MRQRRTPIKTEYLFLVPNSESAFSEVALSESRSGDFICVGDYAIEIWYDAPTGNLCVTMGDGSDNPISIFDGLGVKVLR